MGDDTQAREQREEEVPDNQEDLFAAGFGDDEPAEPVESGDTGDTGRDESNAAFDEAEGEPQGEPQGEQEGDQDGAQEASEAPSREEAAAQDEGEQPASEGPTAEDMLKELGERFERDPEKRTPERILQQVRTWHGRLNKLRQEAEAAEQLRQERDQLKQEVERLKNQTSGESAATGSPAGDSGGADGPTVEVTDEHRKLAREEIAVDNGGEVPAYVEDGDIEQRARHIASREAALAQRATEQARQEVDSRIAPIEQERQQSAEEAHFNQIAESHSDWETVVNSDDFDLWLNEQPPRMREAYDKVMGEGTAADVIAMLDDYKRDRGLVTSDEPGSASAPSQAESAPQQPQRSAPRAPQRPPSRPAAGPSRAAVDTGGSFDDGFNLAG